MFEYYSEVKRNLSSPIRLASLIAASVLLGITGPFGTFLSLEFPVRLGYWSAVVIISAVLVQIIKIFININYLNGGQRTKALITATILTIVLSPVLFWMTDLVIGEDSMYETPLWIFAAVTFSITLLVMYFQHLLGVRTFKNRPRLYSRFRDPKADGIMWITVRDHYVDVYTNRGKETLLMRFSDALAELDGVAGLQVHRSHWVANCAVTGLKKQNGRFVVLLQNGTEVPVSRAYQDAAKRTFG